MADYIEKNQLFDLINALTVDGEFSQDDAKYMINYLSTQGKMEGSPRDMMQVYRGMKEDLPNLVQGEIAYCLDSKELYVGGLNGNDLVTRFDKTSVNVMDFGAIGDGVTDDSEAFQSAIDSGATEIFAPKTKYFIGNTLTITDNCSLIGFDATLINGSTNNEIITATGTLKTTTYLASDYATYDNKMKLLSTENIEVGDIIVLKSNKLWYYDNRGSLFKGETHKVLSVNRLTNEVRTENAGFDGYNLTNENVEVKVYKPLHLVLQGLSFKNGSVVCGSLIDSQINDINIDYPSGKVGLSLNQCFNTIVHNVTIKNIDDIGTGYAIQDNASTLTTVSNSTFSNNRRGVDFSGTTPSRLGVVDGCHVSATGLNNTTEVFSYSSGFGTHGTAEMITFKNNLIGNVKEAFVSRGKTIIIKNNILYERMDFGVSIGDGDDVVVDGNIYQSMKTGKTTVPTDNTRYYSLTGFVSCTLERRISNLTITNNQLDIVRAYILNIHVAPFNLIMSGNSALINSNANTNETSVINGFTTTKIMLTKIYYVNNSFTIGANGSFEFFRKVEPLLTGDCIIDNYKITDTSFLTEWNDDTNKFDERIVNLSIQITGDNKNRNVTISGYIQFTINADVNITINKLPFPHVGSQKFAWYSSAEGVPLVANMLEFLSNAQKLYVSADGLSPSTVFRVATATEYVVPIQLMYNITV